MNILRSSNISSKYPSISTNPIYESMKYPSIFIRWVEPNLKYPEKTWILLGMLTSAIIATKCTAWIQWEDLAMGTPPIDLLKTNDCIHEKSLHSRFRLRSPNYQVQPSF